jgi:cell division protease FtsH
MHEERNYSEKTAQDIDAEVSHLIDDAFKRATDILTEKRETLNELARTLLEKETLEKDELYEIIGKNTEKEKETFI